MLTGAGIPDAVQVRVERLPNLIDSTELDTAFSHMFGGTRKKNKVGFIFSFYLFTFFFLIKHFSTSFLWEELTHRAQ